MKRICCQCHKSVKYIKRPGWEVALDEKGRTWKGAMCPACKPRYNEKYEQKLETQLCDQCFSKFAPANNQQKFCRSLCRLHYFRSKRKASS